MHTVCMHIKYGSRKEAPLIEEHTLLSLVSHFLCQTVDVFIYVTEVWVTHYMLYFHPRTIK